MFIMCYKSSVFFYCMKITICFPELLFYGSIVLPDYFIYLNNCHSILGISFNVLRTILYILGNNVMLKNSSVAVNSNKNYISTI
jgi:hypothetical protein